MTRERLTGIGLLLLGTGVAVSAILGPLILGVIEFHVSDDIENQLIGGEIISLVLAAPLAIVAGVLWLRGHWLAPVLAIGPAVYAVYIYVQFIVGPEYDRYDGNNENAFPLFLALIILGWVIAVRAWSTPSVASLPELSIGLRRALAGLLIVLNIFFALTWVASLADVLNGGAVPREYQESPTLFWLVRLMDLGFVIPASLITAVGLLRRAPWATRLAYPVASFETLLIGAVAGMAVAMAVREDPSASSVLLVVTVAMTLALAVVVALLLRHAARRAKARPTRDERGVPDRVGA